MKPKILYIVNYDISLPISGAPLRTSETIKFLSKEYDVCLVSMEGCSRPPGTVLAQYRHDNPGPPNYVAAETKVRFSRFGHFVFSRPMLKRATRMVRKNHFDLIFADYASTAIYGHLLSKHHNIPWVYSSLNVEYLRFLELARYDLKRYLIVPYYYFIERLACTANLVVAISQDDARFFRKWATDDKVLVIPQGFDPQTYHPFYQQRGTLNPNVLFYGTFNHLPNKQAAHLIYDKILPKVVDRMPQIVFKFVGASPPEDLLHRNVELTGFVNDLVNHIREASVVIAPIIHGGGMRTKIIESLACGKIVISTAKGAEGIPRRYNNLIIVDLDGFPDEICRILRQGTFKLNTDFERLKAEFYWDNILPPLHRKIAEIVNNHKVP